MSKVLKLDNDIYFEMPLLEGYLAKCSITLLEKHLVEAKKSIQEYAPDIIITGAAVIDKSIIDIGKQNGLKGIVKAGTGLDNIEVVYANNLGIKVLNCTTYAAESVAEYAVMFMLSLMRKTYPLQQAIRQEGWVSATPNWEGYELHGKTIGLIGLGHIGSKVARMVHFGFQASVLAYDPFVSAEDMEAISVRKVETLQEVLSQSDIISIHTALTPCTTNLISTEEFQLLKPSALIINVSRGGIIDELALVNALKNEKIGGVALDVFAKEPNNITTHPILSSLINMPNVLLSSHLAWHTAEASKRLQEEVGNKCINIIKAKNL